MAEVFFLFVSGLVLKAPVLGPFRGSQGVLCATYGRYVHIVEVIWARDEVLCGKARFSGDFSTVYSPEAPLCPPLCHTLATTPVPCTQVPSGGAMVARKGPWPPLWAVKGEKHAF